MTRDRSEATATGRSAAVAAVRFDHVTHRYEGNAGPAVALDDVTLDIPAGRVFGVIGHSGAGKSTLIRLANALETPTSGRVLLEGVDLATLTPTELRRAQKSTAMVFQQFNLLETVTVLDNVALPLRLDGTPRPEARERAAEALTFVGLEHKQSSHPAELSGGQMQRVGIARAIVRRPRVLLADEATSALDPTTTKQIIALLRRVNEEYGTTILVVTHEMDVITGLCDDVAVMAEGRIVETGPVLDVFVAPQSPVARSFVDTVIPQDLPARVVRALGGAPLWRIRFLDDEVTSPIVGALSGRFGLDVNILHADMTDIRERTVGNMVVQVDGSPENLRAARAYLEDQTAGVVTVDDDASRRGAA